jgi:hypothetical protein
MGCFYPAFSFGVKAWESLGPPLVKHCGGGLAEQRIGSGRPGIPQFGDQLFVTLEQRKARETRNSGLSLLDRSSSPVPRYPRCALRLLPRAFWPAIGSSWIIVFLPP